MDRILRHVLRYEFGDAPRPLAPERHFEAEPKPAPVPPFDAVSVGLPPGNLQVMRFTGRHCEYFKIWIVCRLLTVLTFGLYAPWAKLRMDRYIWSHWHVGEQTFACSFVPGRLLFGRMAAIFLLLAGVALSYWQPAVTPLLIAVAFAPLPWLLSKSYAFKWRRLSLGKYRFGAKPDAQALRRPCWMLGIILAAVSVAVDFSDQSSISGILVVLIGYLVISWLAWPQATSTALHTRFVQARLGSKSFDLATTPPEIAKHMVRQGLNWRFIAFGLVVVALMFTAMYFLPRDISGVIQAVALVLLAISGASCARARRMNFVIHRLSLGGLRFTSVADPSKLARMNFYYGFLGVCTLGLSLPWASMRMQGYLADSALAHLEGDWSQFDASTGATDEAFATADGLAEAFEIELL